MVKHLQIERFPEGEKAASIIPSSIGIRIGKKTWHWKKRDA